MALLFERFGFLLGMVGEVTFFGKVFHRLPTIGREKVTEPLNHLGQNTWMVWDIVIWVFPKIVVPQNGWL